LTHHRIRDATPVPALLEQTDHPLASPVCGWHLRQEERLRGSAEKGPRPSGDSAHPPGTRRPAQVRPVKSHEGEEQKRPLYPRTGPPRMAQAIRLQPAQHGGEHRLPIQDDSGSRHEQSRPEEATNRLGARFSTEWHCLGCPTATR
jgi:hypothetical protein